MRYVHQISDIPKGEHYVIVTIQGLYIPGDERSRTNPGHGYGERTEYVPSMQVFTKEAEWLNEIKNLVKSDPKAEKFVAYKASKGVEIKHQVEIVV